MTVDACATGDGQAPSVPTPCAAIFQPHTPDAATEGETVTFQRDANARMAITARTVRSTALHLPSCASDCHQGTQRYAQAEESV